ncbi:MAG: AAA family ATPase [Deltaproteobacteria bacterium]|nr:AAA family ATPase [Deltaproteobacteria bacterium]
MTQDSTTPQDFPVLPLGMSTFEELRRTNFVYVDKSKYLLDLLKDLKFISCARPRRFGKSLTLSALDALFLGREGLFRSLVAESYMCSRISLPALSFAWTCP